ncbi:MAG: recombinase family protein [Streptococcus salivarius]
MKNISGHTVNLRTRTKSYKDKRKVDNPKEDWLIFKILLEAIIDQETFDIVRKMRNQRSNQHSQKSGWSRKLVCGNSLFAGTCGQKAHYFLPTRENGLNHDHYKCSGYRKPIDSCESPLYSKICLD